MRLAIYTRSLESARGAERVIASLARGLAARGHKVDLLLEVDRGWLIDVLRRESPEVGVIALDESWPAKALSVLAAAYVNLLNLLAAASALKGPKSAAAGALLRMCWRDRPPIFSLARYVWREQPDVVVSFLNYPNMTLLMAKRLCGRRTRFVVNVRNHISSSAKQGKSKWMRSVPRLMRRLFPWADGILAPSRGVAADIAEITGWDEAAISVVHNPVYRSELLDRAVETVDHPWLQGNGPPVLLAAGKLKPQKDFPTLLRAFAQVRASRAARLVILGEGAKRDELLELARELDIVEDVDLPGQVENPYAFMSRASLFVLSSAFEGLPNALIEALACGCPVVSTDCPSGPAEILENGKFGRLVQVGDAEALAEAINATLEAPPSREALLQRARFFSLENAVSGYEAALACGGPGGGRMA